MRVVHWVLLMANIVCVVDSKISEAWGPVQPVRKPLENSFRGQEQ